jgi:pimeloyl-ACP methyl ester carboxylesterase
MRTTIRLAIALGAMLAASLLPASARGGTLAPLPEKKHVRLATGITMAYFEAGAPAGETLLFLHGLTDSSRSFQLMIEHLTRLRPDLRLVAVDQRGHGASSMPAHERCRSLPEDCFGAAQLAADALALLDGLGVKQATVVGHSMGSIVAQELALTHPERISRIVLLGTSPGGSDNRAVSDFLISGLVEGPWKRALEAKGLKFPEGVYELTPIDADPEAERWMADNWVTEPLADPAFLAAIVHETARVKLGTWIGATRALMKRDNRKRLEGLTVPAFIAWGTQDTLLPKTPDQDTLLAALDVAAKAGRTRYVWKQYGERPPSESRPPDDVGHNLPWAVPEGLARDVAAYLKTGAPTPDLFYGAAGGGVATRPGEAVIVRRP